MIAVDIAGPSEKALHSPVSSGQLRTCPVEKNSFHCLVEDNEVSSVVVGQFCGRGALYLHRAVQRFVAIDRGGMLAPTRVIPWYGAPSYRRRCAALSQLTPVFTATRHRSTTTALARALTPCTSIPNYRVEQCANLARSS